MTLHWVLLAAALAGLTNGCVPFVLPPVRGQLGGGTSQSFEDASSGDGDVLSDSDATLSGRIGLNPLQLFREAGSRVVDVGAGYGGERSPGEGGPGRHGPYAEVAAFPLRGSVGAASRYRAGVMMLGEYFVGGELPHRAGATVAATAEIGGFSSGGFETSDAVGVARGEWALGVFAGPSVRFGRADTAWTGTVGITARVPMMAGLVCCLDVGALQKDRSHERPRAKGRKRRLRREHSTGVRARSEETSPRERKRTGGEGRRARPHR